MGRQLRGKNEMGCLAGLVFLCHGPEKLVKKQKIPLHVVTWNGIIYKIKIKKGVNGKCQRERTFTKS